MVKKIYSVNILTSSNCLNVWGLFLIVWLPNSGTFIQGIARTWKSGQLLGSRLRGARRWGWGWEGPRVTSQWFDRTCLWPTIAPESMSHRTSAYPNGCCGTIVAACSLRPSHAQQGGREVCIFNTPFIRTYSFSYSLSLALFGNPAPRSSMDISPSTIRQKMSLDYCLADPLRATYWPSHLGLV